MYHCQVLLLILAWWEILDALSGFFYKVDNHIEILFFEQDDRYIFFC